MVEGKLVLRLQVLLLLLESSELAAGNEPLLSASAPNSRRRNIASDGHTRW
jgi:hypothetical protein